MVAGSRGPARASGRQLARALVLAALVALVCTLLRGSTVGAFAQLVGGTVGGRWARRSFFSSQPAAAEKQEKPSSREEKEQEPEEPVLRQKKEREELSNELRKELETLASSLGAATGKVADAPGLLSLIRGKVAGLQAMVDVSPPEQDMNVSRTDSELMRHRLQVAQEAIRTAEVAVLEAEAKAEGCEVEVFFPLAAELNKTRPVSSSRMDQSMPSHSVASTVDEYPVGRTYLTSAEASLARTQAKLAVAEARVEVLRAGLQALGGKLGTGGPLLGEVVMKFMDDKALVRDCSEKVALLQRSQR
mmetsp:Transcript_110260/g.351449  ORF Transcript_110260/g.351449 Transcript_110260/m.351449 type:complete len:304 (-) Transcript_110260:93-1004(-)